MLILIPGYERKQKPHLLTAATFNYCISQMKTFHYADVLHNVDMLINGASLQKHTPHLGFLGSLLLAAAGSKLTFKA